MKHPVSMLLFGSGVLALGMAANAQNYPQRDDSYYQNDPNYRNYPDRSEDSRYSQQRGYYPDQNRNANADYGRPQDSLIGRVMADLSAAAYNARLDGHERKHFDDAGRQLEQFENRRVQGKFDSGKLHEAIEDLEHLAKADRLHPRDREILARDIEDLRQFLSNRDQYSTGRYGNYPEDRYHQYRR